MPTAITFHSVLYKMKSLICNTMPCRSVIIAMPLSMSVMHCYAAAGIPVRERDP